MNITIYFPVHDTTVVTVLEKGVLFGVQGAQGVGVPTGGTTNQILAKKTNADYDFKWVANSGGGGGAVDSVNGQTGDVVLTTADIADSTNKRYVTDAQATVIGNTSGTNTGDNATNSQYSGLAASKQDTLVSGTNLKTINSTSLLGSGDIVIAANPSGVAGAIQFSNGSAFASDAANLFWDDTNNRLGIGTNAPTKVLTVNANNNDDGFILRGATNTTIFSITKDGASNNTSELFQYSGGAINFAIRASSNASYFNTGSFTFGTTTNLGAKVNIRGTGNTSATSSLLVQNSGSTDIFRVRDDGAIITGTIRTSIGYANGSRNIIFDETETGVYSSGTGIVGYGGFGIRTFDGAAYTPVFVITGNGNQRVGIGTGSTSPNVSAKVEIASTTQGFLPPRMTTTQKNAISSPASGLVVYDTTLGKLCVRGASAWETITSL